MATHSQTNNKKVTGINFYTNLVNSVFKYIKVKLCCLVYSYVVLQDLHTYRRLKVFPFEIQIGQSTYTGIKTSFERCETHSAHYK